MAQISFCSLFLSQRSSASSADSVAIFRHRASVAKRPFPNNFYADMSSLCAVLVYITCNKYGEREVIMVGMREGFDTGMIPQVMCARTLETFQGVEAPF